MKKGKIIKVKSKYFLLAGKEEVICAFMNSLSNFFNFLVRSALGHVERSGKDNMPLQNK